MSLVGALTKALKAGETAKKTAPFYSAVDEALANIARPKGTGAEFLTELSKQPGVKKAELADRKLEQAFKAKGKMTKEEAQQVLKDNPPPQIKERVINDSNKLEEEQLRDIVSEEMFGKPYDQLDLYGHRSRVSDEVYRRMDTENGTIYGDYKMPGGENYREILLKLPDEKQRWLAKNGQGVERIFNDADEASRFAGPRGDARAMDSQTIDRMRNQYMSTHWKDDPNVLAHMRVQDRTGPNGEKILHVEEIQSDWHQAGRKQGYKSGKNYEKEWKDYQKELLNKYGIDSEDRNLAGIYSDLSGNATPEEMNRLYELKDLVNAESKGVPDAPFKKNWHELAMKRLLNYAADKGYDSIAITPGAEQAKRYDLSKQISRVVYSPETEMLNAFDHNNKSVVMRSGVKPDQVADYIGKEPAQRLFDQQNTKLDYKGGKDVPYQEISGIDLQVGGEGMKGFYDKILPDYLNNFGKPYGAQVESTVMPVNTPEMKKVGDKWQYVDNFSDFPIHTFKVTPEMRESIKQKGLPLYQQIGIPTAGAGAASQMPEKEEGYGAGGVINSAAKMEALAKLAKLKEEMMPRAEAVKALIAKDENKYLRDVAPNSLTNAEIEAEIARMKARAEAAAQPEVKMADGGAIDYNTVPDMSDGGRMIEGAPFKRGGKVKMTANRDTMFLELSNKKLKRK